MSEIEFGEVGEVKDKGPTPTKFKKTKRVSIPRSGSSDPFAGHEPLYVEPGTDETLACLPEDSAMSKVFNWYSAHKDSKDRHKYIMAYLKHTEVKHKKVSLISSGLEKIFGNTAGWIARQITMGAPMPKKAVDYLKAYIKKAESMGVELAKEKRKCPPRKNNIQDAIKRQTDIVLSVLDGEIDKFISNGFKSDFSFKTEYDSSKDWIKPVHLRKTITFIETIKAELELAQSGEDEQLKEGYSHLSKKQMKKFIEFLQNMIVEIGERLSITKQIQKGFRKPRKRKEKPAAVVAQKVKYLKEFPELNLKSVHPSKIIGADQVWIYNTKVKRLALYKANSPHGLSIKGTTIVHYDEKESQEKKLRKPEVVIPKVLEQGKVALRRILEEIRCKIKIPKGRLNAYSIIVRVL